MEGEFTHTHVRVCVGNVTFVLLPNNTEGI